MITKEDQLKLTKEYQLKSDYLNFINNKLASKYWRLDNLYYIRDKYGKLIKMKLNYAQRKILTKYKHNRKIILKSRQQGISTLYVAYYLDSCIFRPGYSAGIQSYGLDEAEKLANRAKLMWDMLDKDIKKLLGIEIINNNSKGIVFNNGSILKIGNFRGDTLQGLHVSELGKIAKYYPEKAKELKAGAFQAVATNNKITIESTALGPNNLFYEMWKKAVARADAVGIHNLTPLDFQPIFLSWLEDPDCRLEEYYPQSERSLKYIKEIEKELKIELTQEQKNWVAAKMAELGDEFDQEYPATPERAFMISSEGYFFLEEYKKLKEQGRIREAKYNPRFPVYVSFDLGISDETVILFAQLIDGVPYIIDEYAGKDHGIKFYSNLLKSKPYSGNYAQIFFPHDINVRDFSTGRTRLETFIREGWGNAIVLPKLSFQDSIEAARQLLNICVIDKNLENTLLAIQNYRKKYDKFAGIYLNKEVHDIHSHYMAAFRYMAQGLGYYKVRKSKIINKKVVKRFKGYAI